MMLVLRRRKEETVVITVGDDTIRIKVIELRSGDVKLAFTAPPHITIDREEIHNQKEVV
jgi:carbon storage regulator CsrA